MFDINRKLLNSAVPIVSTTTTNASANGIVTISLPYHQNITPFTEPNCFHDIAIGTSCCISVELSKVKIQEYSMPKIALSSSEIHHNAFSSIFVIFQHNISHNRMLLGCEFSDLVARTFRVRLIFMCAFETLTSCCTMLSLLFHNADALIILWMGARQNQN